MNINSCWKAVSLDSSDLIYSLPGLGFAFLILKVLPEIGQWVDIEEGQTEEEGARESLN